MSTISSGSNFSVDASRSRRRRSRSATRSRSRSPQRARIHSKRIIIANIPYDVTWFKLKELFREKLGFTGFLKMCKFKGKPNGLAIMDFKTYEGAEKAIELMHRYELGDRKLVVREETMRDVERLAHMEFDGPGGAEPNVAGGNEPSSHPVSKPPAGPVITPQLLEKMGIEGPVTDSVYISNLHYNVTWQKLKEVFKLAGRVVSVHMRADREGNPRGVASVKFETPYEAVQAINMFNGQMLNDRIMRVKVDRQGTPANAPVLYPPQGVNTAGSAGLLGTALAGSWHAPDNGPSSDTGNADQVAATVAALATLLNTPRASAGGNNVADLLALLSGGQSTTSPLSLRLQGSNLGSQLISQLLLGHSNPSPALQLGNRSLHGGGGMNSPNANPPIAAGVQKLIAAATAGGMSQSQIANTLSALGLTQDILPEVDSPQNGGHYSRRPVDDVRRRSLGVERHAVQSGVGVADLMEVHKGANFRPHSGADHMMPAVRSPSGAYPTHLSTSVVVRNIPYSLGWLDIKRMFREAGELQFVNLQTDSQGRSQGVAHVGFARPEEAHRARARFNDFAIDGRRLKVHYE